VDIHLEENEWDDAIKIAEKDFGSFRLLEKAADAVIPYRPDWVIRVAIKQAEFCPTAAAGTGEEGVSAQGSNRGVEGIY
jgi:hypothetical protein